jgi:hypothetical protein
MVLGADPKHFSVLHAGCEVRMEEEHYFLERSMVAVQRLERYGRWVVSV